MVGRDEAKQEGALVLSPTQSESHLAEWAECEVLSHKGSMKGLRMFTGWNSTCQRRRTGFVGGAFLVLQ